MPKEVSTICGRSASLFEYEDTEYGLVVYKYRGVRLERLVKLYRIEGAIGVFYDLSEVLDDIDKILVNKNKKRNKPVEDLK